MFKQALLCIFIFAFTTVKAQELNCNVVVNAEQIQVSNNQVFKTLENSLTEFMNQTQWTNSNFKEHEKIKCSITILLTEQTSTNNYRGTIQIQASRPVFNTSYYSPILNHKDNSFTFQYTEFQPLNYNPNAFESNLVATLSYYAYIILGMYADTFNPEGGTAFLSTSLKIANQAQQSGYVGWENKIGDITRFTLVDKMLSIENKSFRDLMFQYHYDVMDVFEKNQLTAINKVIEKLKTLETIYNKNSNSFMLRVFLDAKADEIVNILKNSKTRNIDDLLNMLKKISPSNSKKWKQISF